MFFLDFLDILPLLKNKNPVTFRLLKETRSMLIIEGNIGVGKSTFLKKIQALWPLLEIVQEPVENWDNNCGGKSLLSQFYQYPNRWAYTLETLCMLNRVKEHLENQKETNFYRLVERSIYSGHYCFAKNDLAQGFLNATEWAVYQTWVDFFIKQHCNPPLGFIYLRAKPEVCHDRIMQRNRASEQGIGIEYLEQIHTLYEKFLLQKSEVDPRIEKVPVLVLDCNQEFEHDQSVMSKHLSKIQEFIESLQTPINFATIKKNREFSLT